MRLYCSEQYKRSLIQSSLAIGSLLGLIIMNVISDIKGRRFALLVDLFIATLSALRTLFVLLSYLYRRCGLKHTSAGAIIHHEWVQRLLFDYHCLYHTRRCLRGVNETKVQCVYQLVFISRTVHVLRDLQLVSWVVQHSHSIYVRTPHGHYSGLLFFHRIVSQLLYFLVKKPRCMYQNINKYR